MRPYVGAYTVPHGDRAATAAPSGTAQKRQAQTIRV